MAEQVQEDSLGEEKKDANLASNGANRGKSITNGGKEEPGNGKRKRKRRKPKGKPKITELSNNNSGSGSQPSWLSDTVNPANTTTQYNEIRDASGRLITRTTIEHIKISPMGDYDSVFSNAIEDVLAQINALLIVNNIEVTLPKGSSIDITRSELDEYLEMIINFIMAIEALHSYFEITRDTTTTYSIGILQYCSGVLRNIPQPRQKIRDGVDNIRKLLIPPNILPLLHEVIGLFESTNSNSLLRTQWVGVQIPTNFKTYKLPLPNNQFSSESNFKQRTVYEEVINAEEGEETNYYARDGVVNLPPVSMADIRGLKAIIENFSTWQNDQTGVYSKISRIFGLIVPQWNMRTYSLSDWGGMKVLSPAIANYHRNLDILQSSEDNSLKSVGHVNDPLDEIVYFSSSNDEQIGVKILLLYWRTYNKIVQKEKKGETDDTIPFETKVVNYPGIVSRLPVRDTEGNYHSNPRFLIGRDGVVFPVQLETDAITLGYRYHQGTLLEEFEILKERDDVVRVQIEAFEEYFSRYAKWYLSYDDIMSSPVFSSNTILNSGL